MIKRVCPRCDKKFEPDSKFSRICRKCYIPYTHKRSVGNHWHEYLKKIEIEEKEDEK